MAPAYSGRGLAVVLMVYSVFAVVLQPWADVCQPLSLCALSAFIVCMYTGGR